jgi:hypothetical protein
MLCGRLPFSGPTSVSIVVKHATEQPPAPGQFNRALSHAVEAVIMKALAKRPEQRYNSAGELAHALRLAIASSDSDAHSASQALPSQESEHPSLIATFLNNDTIPETPALSSLPFSHSRTTVSAHLQEPASPVPPASPRQRKRRGRVASVGLLLLALLVLAAGTTTYFRLLPVGGATPTPRATPQTPQRGSLPALPTRVGPLLYSTPLPDCPTSPFWLDNNKPRITCSASSLELSNLQKHFLASLFLDHLPGGASIPDRYLLRVQATQSLKSQNTFGIIFRSQPGAQNQGAYSFLLDPAGFWNAYAYNNANGSATWLSGGATTLPIKGQLTIDVLVDGNTFTLYLNGVRQGTTSDRRYPHGSVGFTVDVDADIFFKNLQIYALPDSE